jgi:hypothetical protein
MSDERNVTVSGGEVTERRPETYAVVENAISLLDSNAFEHLQRVATMMAAASLIPECLRGDYEGRGDNRRFVPHQPATVLANCFMIAEQSVRWNMSPFAVAQSCSIVRGKLMYEGKLVAAVIEARAGVKLTYTFGKWNPKTESVDTSVEGENDLLGVVVSDDEGRTVEGSVGTWKTTQNDTPWRPGAFKRMCRYRGAREWCRAHEPGVMLGVLTDDEIDDLRDRRFAHEPRPTLTAGFGDEPPPRVALSAPVAAEPEPAAEDSGKAREAAAAQPTVRDEPAQQQTATQIEQDPLVWNGTRYPNKTRLNMAKQEAPRAEKEAAKPKPAPSAEDAKPTPDSATPASGGSAEETSSQKQPAEPSHDGGEVATQGFIDPDTGVVYPTMEARLEASRGATPHLHEGLWERLQEQTTWDGARGVLAGVAQSDAWARSDDAGKREVRRLGWVRYGELRANHGEETRFTENYALMRMYLDFGARSSDDIADAWVEFRGSDAYKTAREEDQKSISALAARRQDELDAQG